MNVTPAGIAALANQLLCSSDISDDEAQDWLVDFLSWAYAIAPEGAVAEAAVLTGTSDVVQPAATGVAEVRLDKGAYKVLSVYQSEFNTLTTPRFRGTRIDPVDFQAIADHFPATSKVYARSNAVWAQFNKVARMFRCESSWYVGLEYLALPDRSWSTAVIPLGWDNMAAIYCAARWQMRDEEVDLAAAHLSTLQSEMGRFGVYYDEHPSLAGAGGTPSP